MSLPVIISLPSRIPTALTPPSMTPEVVDPTDLVERSIESVVSVRESNQAVGLEDSFFIADLGVVYRQFRQWTLLLPGVIPHYAVKCNGDPQVVKMLANLGAGFDCASVAEIQQVMDAGVEPSRIVYANTIKNPSYLRFAEKAGVTRMTFDNADELRKIKQHLPSAELLLRIYTDDSDAVCSLSCKFGARLDTVQGLLELARDLELSVVGVAFHIGSGGGAVDNYAKALKDAHLVFGWASRLGHSMRILDIGGGFEPSTFPAAAASIQQCLSELDFGAQTQVIAEPGRFMVAEAFTLATCVVGRRMVGNNQGMLYLSDGCYGNLNCVIYDHQTPLPQLLSGSKLGKESSGPMEASLWGPTCDGIDKIKDRHVFQHEVDVGDWVYFRHTGAYTLAASTQFNGFNKFTEVHYVCSDMPDLVAS